MIAYFWIARLPRLDVLCVPNENSILPEISRIRMEGVTSENLICLIQDRPAARAESGTPHESGPFSAESSFRYTQRARERHQHGKGGQSESA